LDHRTQVTEQIDYVARTLARLGVRASDVEDLTQEVLIVAIRRLDSFDSARRLEPWLFGIARNVARDFRRLARHRIEQSDGSVVATHAVAADSPAEHTNLRQRAELLRKVVAELEETLQEVIVLHDLDEIPMAEVAASLSISIDTAYARLRRGRATVRKQLADLGGSRGLD
jgi:RNA polymerase sigma-70 factor, ECF subfamily